MKHACFWLLLCLLWPASRLLAQAAPAPISLADALKAMPVASVGDGSVALTVGAERVTPMPPPPQDAQDALPDNPIATPQSLAVQYGRLGGWFGHVYALAPPTMTILNTSAALADLPLSMLASHHPLPFLVGTLTADQVRLMGTTGLAFGDLTPDQQALLKAALPQPLQVVARSVPPPVKDYAGLIKPGADRKRILDAYDAEVKAYEARFVTIPEETLESSLRLRAFLIPQYNLDTPDNSSIDVNYAGGGLDKTVNYLLAVPSGSIQQKDKPLEDALRAEAPNESKPGDLLWNRHDLEHGVSLEGVKSVDDLIGRLARATNVELYADPRYGALSLLLTGDLHKPQPAGDMMQALALCVCGTWRRVGPAFVLTDDVRGLGTRRAALQEAVQAWSNRLTGVDKGASGHLAATDWLHILPFALGDIGALSPAQMAAFPEKPGGNDGHVLWKDLAEPLRASLRQGMKRDDMIEDSYNDAAEAVARSLKPGTPVSVSFNLQLAVELPEMGVMPLNEEYAVQAGDAPAPSKPVQAHSIPVPQKGRGVLCAPKTAEEARMLVTHLPKQGFNLLFLDVFTGGRTYFANDALPPVSDGAAGVLQAALDAAKPLHIPVYAVLDTLCWRKDGGSPHPQPWPAGYGEELTVTGEASDVAVRRQSAAGTRPSGPEYDYLLEQRASQSWASPLDPNVRRLLPALVRTVAGTKGLAGLVFQDTAPPGYLGQEAVPFGNDLGYTPLNRLAYLRAHQIDPVDLGPYSALLIASLPGDTFMLKADIPTFPLAPARVGYGTWSKFLADADQTLLADCFAAARRTAPTLPLWMREERLGFWFDPWRDPKTPVLIAPATPDDAFPQISAGSIVGVPYGPVERANVNRFVELATDFPDINGRRAGGVVFDLTTGGPPDSLTDTLDRLAALLKKPDTAAKEPAAKNTPKH